MFDENKENDLLMGNDLDLGSSSDDIFAGFGSFNGDFPSGLFSEDDKSESENKSQEKDDVCDGKTERQTEENAEEIIPTQESAIMVNSENQLPVQEEENIKGEKIECEKKQELEKPAEELSAEADATEESNIWQAAIAEANEKQAEAKKSSLMEKLPFFVHGNAKEEIVDTSKTFEQLRLEKAEDFPELDEGENVSWKITYGSVIKQVTNKKATIASLKKQIEESAAFMKELKNQIAGKKEKSKTSKNRDEEIECRISPVITAKKKGVMSQYKGVYTSIEDAVKSGKVISFVPSEDGKVFEVRNNAIGTFIAETNKIKDFNKVRAGFIPALPKIPYEILSQILSFFKSFVHQDGSLEALAYIYWSVEEGLYRVFVPRQKVARASVDTIIPDLDEERFILVMEIHSHNTMSGIFSPTDDRDEKATRLYTVIGKLNNVFPEINTRISCGGKYVEIEPSLVFEGFKGDFPTYWREAVVERKPKCLEVEI